MGYILHAVERPVEGRTDQIVHAGIDDSEQFILAMLDVEHPRDEVTALCNDRTSEFAMEMLVGTQVEVLPPNGEIVLEIGDGEVVRMFV